MNRLNSTKCTKWQWMIYGNYGTSLQSKSSIFFFLYATQRKINWALENLHLLISLTQSLIPQIVSHIIWIISIFLHNPIVYFHLFSFRQSFYILQQQILYRLIEQFFFIWFQQKMIKNLICPFSFSLSTKSHFFSLFLQIT